MNGLIINILCNVIYDLIIVKVINNLLGYGIFIIIIR